MPQYQQAATLVDVAERHYAQGDDLMKEARGMMSLGDVQRHRIVKPYPGGSLEGGLHQVEGSPVSLGAGGALYREWMVST